MRLLLATLSLSASFSGVFASGLFAQTPAPAAGEPRRAPSFTLMDYTTGQFHDLLDYRGRVVVLEIMKTSCPHCKMFTGVLEKLKVKHGAKLAVLMVVNPPETPETMKAYQQETKSTSPLLYDSGQVAVSYVRSGRIDLPRVYLIDAQGMIRGDFSYGDATKGMFEKGGITAEVDKLIAKK